MARTDGRLLPANAGVQQTQLLAALINSGVTKVADDTERATLTAPAAVSGVTPIELVFQLDTAQWYTWEGSPGVLTPVYPAQRFTPPAQLAALLESESNPRSATVLTRSLSAREYSKTIGQGRQRIAMDIGGGYPNKVVLPGTGREIDVSPLRGDISTPTGGDRPFMVFTLASPLDSSAEQDTLELRGSTTDRAVLSPALFGAGAGQPGTGTGLAGFQPAVLGAAGTAFFSTGAGTVFREILLNDISGFENAGAPVVGTRPEYTAAGWRYTPKGSGGIDFTTGLEGQLVGKGAGNSQAWYTPNFDLIQGFLPLGKFVDPAGLPLNGVPQIIETAGVRSWRVQVPTFVVPPNSVGPNELDAGPDPAKQLALRTALGMPTGTARALLMLGANNTLQASALFFPADDRLRLFHSATDLRELRTTALGVELVRGTDNYLVFNRRTASLASVESIGNAALQLSGVGLNLSAGTGRMAFLAAGFDASGNPVKPGQALGIGGSGGPEGLDLYRAQPTQAHWTAVVTCGSGASGNGYDTAAGNSFGSITDNDFVFGGSTYVDHQLIQDSSNAIKLSLKPVVSSSVYSGWSLTVEGHTMDFADATVVGDARYPPGISTEFTWANQPAGLIPSSGQVTVNLNHTQPYIPAAGPDGQVMTASGGLWTSAAPAAGPSTPGQPGTPLTVTPRQDRFRASRSQITPLVVGTEYQLSLAAASPAAHAAPFSVASNQIQVAAGTAPFMATVNWEIYVDPTNWVNNNRSGGNRLFFNMNVKKSDVYVPSAGNGVYIRGDEDWAPVTHTVQGSFTTILTGGDNLTFYFQPESANRAGAEIRGVQLNASDITITSQTYAGGSGGGMGGSSSYIGLSDTESAAGTENQVDAWNAAGQLRHRNLGDLLNTVSNAGRNVLWMKPSTGPGSQYTDDISKRVILPADYLSYDFIYWGSSNTSADYLAGRITDHRIWPVWLLGSANITNVDGSRLDWTASTRTLGAGDDNDRFERVVLMRGQGPPGPMGNPGPGGTGVQLQTAGVPQGWGTAYRGVAVTASRSDHVHPNQLVADSVLPAYAVADTAAQIQAWHTRLDLEESSAYVFWRSTITPAGSNGFSILSSGVISDNTFEYLGTTYTVRRWESDGVGSFSINVTPAPSATLFNNLVAHFRGVSLRFRDASTTTNTGFASPGRPAGRSWTWANNHRDILPTSGVVDIALAEDVGTAIERIETDLAAVRQVPAQPSDPTEKLLYGDNVFRGFPALVRTARECNVIANIAQATVRDRTPQTVPLSSLSGDHTAMGVSLSANALRVTRPGLYFVDYGLDASIVSSVQFQLNRGNTNQRGSVSKLFPYPSQEDAYVKGGCPIAVTAADTISLQWIALDIPALTSGVPPAPTAISIAAVSGSPGQFTVGWTFSGSRVNTWTVEWRYSGETLWHTDRIVINRQAARQASVNTRHTSSTGIDVRVWGANATGVGLYAQRTWGTTGTDGTFTRENAHSQTFAAVGDLVVRAEDWSH